MPTSSRFPILALLLAARPASAAPFTFTIFAGPAGGSGIEDGLGAGARFDSPTDLAVDAVGFIVVADSGNSTLRRVSPAGDVTTLAGLARTPGVVDGLGSAARFFGPGGVAFDSAGNGFIADACAIRKVTPGGQVTAFAGVPGDCGAGDGAGSAARFSGPSGIAIDAADNLYVADRFNHTVRKVTPGGLVTTLAGSAGSAGSDDGPPATARFTYPAGVAVTATRDVYVADWANHTIRLIPAVGPVSTVAGSPGVSGSADGNGSAARFLAPSDVAVLPNGDVYVADQGNHTIRKVAAGSRNVTTPYGAAGSPGSDDGAGNAARFNEPVGLALDAALNLLVADGGNHTVRRVSTAGDVTTLAGLAGGPGTADGPAAKARFRQPQGIALDGSGNLYVADAENHSIRKVSVQGVTTLAGLPGTSGSADGLAGSARFKTPTGIAIDLAGNLLVADELNSTVRSVTLAGTVTTVAGQAGVRGSQDGTGAVARFASPNAIVCCDATGNAFLTDYGNHTVRRLTPLGQVSTLAGAAGIFGSADGSGSAARFWFPAGIAIDGSGNLYVADVDNATVRKVSPLADVTTVAGLARSWLTADGRGAAARFNQPRAVTAAPAGDLFVADTGNHTLRAMTPSGDVTTLAGAATERGSQEGTAGFARFAAPAGLVAGPGGTLYVADTANHRILIGRPALDDRATIDAGFGGVGQPRQLDALPRTATSWSWRIIRRPSASSATLSSTTVPNPLFTPDQGELYVFRLEADGPGGKSITTVSLLAGCAVTFDSIPAERDVCYRGSTTFSVVARGTPPLSYQWCKDGDPIPGATAPDYAIPTVFALDDAAYTCQVHAPCGWAVTPPARLSVLFEQLPTAVGNTLQAGRTGGIVHFAWTDVPGAAGYSLFEDTVASGPFETLSGMSTTGVLGLDLPLAQPSLVFYRVAARNGGCVGPR